VGEKVTVPGKSRKLKVSHILILLLLIGAGVFTLYRLNLKKQLKSRIEAIHATGYPVTLEELDQWYAIPDDSENAAYIILDAFDYYQEPQDSKLLPLFGKVKLPARTEPLPEETMKLVSQYLSDNQQTLELLHEAAALEHSRYPIDLSLGLGTLAPPLQDLKQSVKLLNLEAITHAEKNESMSATRSLISGLGIANSLSEEPLIVSQLVRISCQAMTVSILERVINRTDLTDEQLIELGRDFTNAQNLSGISRAFVGERCQILHVFRGPESLQSLAIGSSGQDNNIPVPILQAYKALGLADMDAVDYLDMMDGYIKAFQLPQHLRQEAFNAAELKPESISKFRILLRTLMPALRRIITIDLRNIAGLQTAQAAIAIQRYRLAMGGLPEKLKELVPDYLESIPTDPFDGEELRYKKLETGFVIYSIGEDLSDDNGTEMPRTSIERQKNRNWDITFIIER